MKRSLNSPDDPIFIIWCERINLEETLKLTNFGWHPRNLSFIQNIAQRKVLKRMIFVSFRHLKMNLEFSKIYRQNLKRYPAYQKHSISKRLKQIIQISSLRCHVFYVCKLISLCPTSSWTRESVRMKFWGCIKINPIRCFDMFRVLFLCPLWKYFSHRRYMTLLGKAPISVWEPEVENSSMQ